MTPAQLARVLYAAERRTWGVHDATTHHLGLIFRDMAEECDQIAKEEAEASRPHDHSVDGPAACPRCQLLRDWRSRNDQLLRDRGKDEV